MNRVILLCMLLCLCAGTAWAQIPQTISYQGRLTDNTGAPVADGSYTLTFRLYTLNEGGSAVWTETQTATTRLGLFTVALGSVTPLNLAFDRAYWLGLTIGAGTELIPRRAVLADAYALVAQTVVDTAITAAKLRDNAVTAAKLADNAVTAAKISPNIVSSVDGVTNDAGNVDLVAGSNITITPNDAANTITFATTAGGDITSVIAGEGLSGGGQSGDVSLSVAVPLYVGGPVAAPAPVFTSHNTSNGIAAEGNSTDGWGVFGFSNTSIGIVGWTYSAVYPAIWGKSDETSNEGWLASSDAGAKGTSPNGTGVYGTSTTGAGVYGTSTSGPGVKGVSSTHDGVRGESDGANKSGVFGYTSNASGWAGYFTGPVYVNGTLGAAVKNFKIDHPLDPANKYLLHSSVESSEMKDIYDGVVTLDSRGEATVVLPDWFEALNKDFRYQLTAIGAPGPNLYIKQKVQDNRFVIAGGSTGMEVSWMITGIRHDPYAEAHPLQVETDKTGEEAGKYLHPVEYHQPETAGIDYTRVREQKPDMRTGLPVQQTGR